MNRKNVRHVLLAWGLSSMVAYLLSDEGAWINGQVVNVDGGIVLR